MSEKDKVSNSLVAGELRKAARLYEVFKHASEGADLLANLEKEVKRFEGQKASLDKEWLELDAACNAAVERANKAEEATQAAKRNTNETIKQAETKVSNMLSKAKVEAEGIIQSGKDIVTSMQGQVDKLKEEIHTINMRKDEALKSQQAAEEELKEIKAKFLKAVE